MKHHLRSKASKVLEALSAGQTWIASLEQVVKFGQKSHPVLLRYFSMFFLEFCCPLTLRCQWVEFLSLSVHSFHSHMGLVCSQREEIDTFRGWFLPTILDVYLQMGWITLWRCFSVFLLKKKSQIIGLSRSLILQQLNIFVINSNQGEIGLPKGQNLKSVCNLGVTCRWKDYLGHHMKLGVKMDSQTIFWKKKVNVKKSHTYQRMLSLEFW